MRSIIKISDLNPCRKPGKNVDHSISGGPFVSALGLGVEKLGNMSVSSLTATVHFELAF